MNLFFHVSLTFIVSWAKVCGGVVVGWWWGGSGVGVGGGGGGILFGCLSAGYFWMAGNPILKPQFGGASVCLPLQKCVNSIHVTRL